MLTLAAVENDHRAGKISSEALPSALASLDAPSFALTESVVGAHDVAVFTEGSRAELLRWDAFCRGRTVRHHGRSQ
jgi:hypothetical protein